MIISIFDNTTGKFLHTGHAKYDKDSDTYTGKDPKTDSLIQGNIVLKGQYGPDKMVDNLGRIQNDPDYIATQNAKAVCKQNKRNAQAEIEVASDTFLDPKTNKLLDAEVNEILLTILKRLR
jgi:hypothetical protein